MLCAGKPRGWLHVQFEDEAAVERACRLTGAQLLDRAVFVDGPRAQPKPDPGKPVEGCWFCLSNPTADTELIVSIGKALHTKPDCQVSDLYFTTDVGAKVNDHGVWAEGGGRVVRPPPAWKGKGGRCPSAPAQTGVSCQLARAQAIGCVCLLRNSGTKTVSRIYIANSFCPSDVLAEDLQPQVSGQQLSCQEFLAGQLLQILYLDSSCRPSKA